MANDEDIICVVIKAGNRGFSAGGYENLLRKQGRGPSISTAVFPTEYELDYKIINYPKPIIAFLDGIVMGEGQVFPWCGL